MKPGFKGAMRGVLSQNVLGSQRPKSSENGLVLLDSGLALHLRTIMYISLTLDAVENQDPCF